MQLPVLSIIIFLPILGSLLLLFIRNSEEDALQRQRLTALLISVINFLFSLSLLFYVDASSAELALTEYHQWSNNPKIAYFLGIDGLSLFFILLNNLLLPICIIASWNNIAKYQRLYLASFLLLTAMVNGMFAAQDLLLFYIFFEAVLIPMFLIIGIWGGDSRVYAAFKFFLYTLAGSIFMLLAIIYMIDVANSAAFADLRLYNFAYNAQLLLFIGFFLAFAVKIPMWPLHTWLPDAHVQAPTAGSVMLAAILLKMGGYGMIRILITMLPEASNFYASYILVLSAIAVIYTSLVALVQRDMKKLIAYSSVAHMAFVTAGIFASNQLGLQGAVMQMLSHGVVSAALFLIVGVVYDRLHTRSIDRFQGLVNVAPDYALVFMVFMFASVGLPGTSGFIGEILVIIASVEQSPWIALCLASAMVLGAGYMLYLYKRMIFGKVKDSIISTLTDLSGRELVIFIPLILIMFWMGLYPAFFLDYLQPVILNLLTASPY